MRGFIRFVALGVYSPSRVGVGLEPMPAPTLRARLAQWRRREQWPAELRARAEARAAVNPMDFEEFMAVCHRISAAAFGDYDDGGGATNTPPAQKRAGTDTAPPPAE